MNPHDSQIHFCAVSVVMCREGTPTAPPYSTPMRGRIPTLELLVFVVGTTTLGAEIAAARLMAPFFGDSTIVWANTIAIVLVALSVGYWFGGRMADRHPDLRGLCLLVMVAAVLLALVPLVAHPFLSLSVEAFDTVSIGTFAGSLLGVLALVAVPVLMLGAVSPWAIRLKLRSVEDSGEVAGRMYAISTVGSLVGTFLAALLLIPLVGTQRIFMVFALALALVAVLGLGVRWLPAPLLVAALLVIPPGTIKSSGKGRVIYEAETEYQYARVVQYPDGVRRLELNEGQAIHSSYHPGSALTGGYWDGLLVDPVAALPRPPRRVAMLGTAAGTTARAYAAYLPATRVDAVEIDGELLDIGRRYFDLRPRPQLRTITEDARPFLRQATDRYDVIMVDAYRQPYIPFYLTTEEFFALCRDRLAGGGVVAINVGHPEGSQRLEQVLTATLRAVFPYVARDPLDATNTILMASGVPLTSQRMVASADTLPPDLRPLARRAAARLQPGLSGGTVYTDDRAPVEWLVDKSLIGYAEGSR
jgi:spermidine synthase